MSILSNIAAFLWAIAEHWLWIALAGVPSVISESYKAFKGKDLPFHVHARLIFVGGALIAVFLAWSDENQKRISENEKRVLAETNLATEKTARATDVQDLKNQIAELKEPQLQAWIVGINIIGVNLKEYPDETLAIFIVSLANTGAPSIADSWVGQVTLKDGRVLTGRSITVPKKKLFFQSKTYKTTYSSNDALYKKALKEPIARGSKITGILMFGFKGIGPMEFPPNGASLTFRDVNGKEYTAINNPKGVVPPRYFYGLEEEG